MASSNREARIAASSFHMPVVSNNGTLSPEYEEALAAALEGEREKAAQAPAGLYINISEEDDHKNYENIVNFSDIYHSNEEYFRKLEELKAAHIETMAKLEKMYHNKLNLKEVQPLIIKENVPSVSSSSMSEKNSYHPIPLLTSLSEPDLGRSSSLYTSSSEEELPNLEKEHTRKNKMMNYAKELINNMWTNFRVKDYIQCEDSEFQVEKKKKKPKEWAPVITVPVPFQMMIREQKKREEAMKSKSDIEMLQKLFKKEEDSECKKRFRANPVPAYVLLPLYHDMVKQKEERRRNMREKSKEALLNSQKPFMFIAREEQKQAAREKQLRDFFKPKKKNRFKARPLPRSIYGSTSGDRLKEDDSYRNIGMQLRAQELLQNSSCAPCKPPCRRFRNHKGPEQTRKSRRKNRVRYQTPDAKDLPEKHKTCFSEHTCPQLSASWEPSDFLASLGTSAKREKVLADIKSDEENLQETCWPFQIPAQKSPVRSASAKPCNCSPPVPTASSRGREQAIRKSEKERMREYRQELQEREEKLKKRPLLFERVAQVVFIGI